jgi:hypothetical protein
MLPRPTIAKGGSTMATFRIWYIGTDDFAIEEASSELEACQKTGRNSEDCEVQRIPDENIVRESYSLSAAG